MRAQPITALGVGLLMCSVLPVSGCGPTNGNAGSHNDYTITDRVTSLAIDNPVGNTRIEGTDATTVSVTEQLRYTGNPPQTRHEITDGQLTLSYTCPAEVNNVDGDACSVTYLVRCPTTRCTNQWPGRYSNVDRARWPPDPGLQHRKHQRYRAHQPRGESRGQRRRDHPNVRCAPHHRGRAHPGRFGEGGTASRYGLRS